MNSDLVMYDHYLVPLDTENKKRNVEIIPYWIPYCSIDPITRTTHVYSIDDANQLWLLRDVSGIQHVMTTSARLKSFMRAVFEGTQAHCKRVSVT